MLLRHPTLKGVTRTVPDGRAKEWADAGWEPVKTTPPETSGPTTTKTEK
ncbi:MAG: hypothetical protein LBL55_09335 [Propionibacteriaceae bacterium]|jgi:hypothetical protein|nr:hypothetical protein [Propionibacteriaceae bacterium]